MFDKKILLVGICVFAFANAAFADNDFGATDNSILNAKANGPYLGAQLGIASTDYRANDYVLESSSKVYNNKMGGRVYGGYAYDEHLATEIGYTYYNNPEFLAQNSGAKEDFSQQGLDLTARASIPFQHGLGAYLKAGGTWIYRTAFTGNNTAFVQKDSSNKFAFLVGGALTLNFNVNWMVDLSWTRILKNGDLATTDFYALGLNYKF